MIESLTAAIKEEFRLATATLTNRAARAARGGAIIGAALGGALSVVLLALGFILGRIS